MTDLKAKMHQIRFRLRLRPRPRWGNLQHSPRPLAGFGGCFAAGEGAGLAKRRERGGRVKWRRGKGSCPQVTVEPGPLIALLRHCAVVHSSQNCVVRYWGGEGVLLKRVLVLGALPHGGNELDEPGVLGLLQTAHHAMLHHRHKLLVTQLSVVCQQTLRLSK